MDATRHEQQAFLEANKSRSKFHLRRVLHRAGRFQRDVDRSKGHHPKRYRYHKHLSALVGLLALGSPAFADSVGGVSATANPIAQSSSSVSNQAVQILQGPYIQSAVTAGVQCHGSNV